MSIQYGSTPITDVKYCDPQGTLKDVSSVVRNGTNVWESVGGKTNNRGVWTRWDGLRFVWSSNSSSFVTDDPVVYLLWNEDYNGYEYSRYECERPYTGLIDEVGDSATFMVIPEDDKTFTWSAS